MSPAVTRNRSAPEAKQLTAASKRSRGRPTKFLPEYCEQMVAFCAKGFSLTGFAGHIGVSRDTLSEWGREHREFSAAIKTAKAAAALFYEKRAQEIAKNGAPGGAATITIFALKNMAPDDWKDRHEIDHSGNVEATLRADTIDFARRVAFAMTIAAIHIEGGSDAN